MDTWWQTETGSIMMSPIPGITATKPGSCTIPFFGVVPEVVKKDGTRCKPNEGGFLVIKQPWPSMLRGIHGDPDRYVKQYWSEIPGVYFTGDGSRQDEDGYFWVMGRVDDVLNVAGHRLGTAEIESALVSHPAVAEAAVVGPPHELKGQGICCFVTLKQGNEPTDALKKELSDHVVKEIGALARPDDIRFTDALPEDPLGQDHAPAAEGDRHQRRGQGRHHHAGRHRRPHPAGRQPRRRGVKAGLNLDFPHPYPLPRPGRGQSLGGDSGRETADRADCLPSPCPQGEG